ncbi:hypothetical protein HK102_003024, partial [Quaeritorhiza haematococci]
MHTSTATGASSCPIGAPTARSGRAHPFHQCPISTTAMLVVDVDDGTILSATAKAEQTLLGGKVGDQGQETRMGSDSGVVGRSPLDFILSNKTQTLKDRDDGIGKVETVILSSGGRHGRVCIHRMRNTSDRLKRGGKAGVYDVWLLEDVSGFTEMASRYMKETIVPSPTLVTASTTITVSKAR